MEIVSSNIEENLGFLYEAIESAEFISIDTEFTGLFNREEDEFDEADTLEERYGKLRLTCEEYFMCQLGICTYSYESESNSYIVHPFNLYTLPSSPNHPMKIHPSSMRFLVDNGFDMNKLFKQGLCCTRLQESNLTPISHKKSHFQLGKTSENLVIQYVNTLLQFINSPEIQSIDIEVPSKYIKNLLQGPAGALKHFKNLKYHTMVENNKSVMKVRKNPTKVPIFSPPQRTQTETTEEEIFNSLGATLVFAAVLKANVPIVLHNGLFDIGFLYTHFINSLPSTLDLFKSDVVSLFPPIFDTKTIAKSIDIPALNRVNLEGLYKTCLHSLTFKDTVRFRLDERVQGCLDGEKTHEAAYDAYITGVSFLHLREYLRQKSEDLLGVNQFKNLVCLNKSNKYYLNLNYVADNHARSENIIKFKVNCNMQASQIAEYLAKYGDVLVRKIAEGEYTAKFERYDRCTISVVIKDIKESTMFLLLTG